MPLIQTARAAIWYADQRKATSAFPLIVLVHGAGSTHLDWPRELRRLPGVSLVAPDLPGHGRSPLPGRQSIPDYTADVIALLDALRSERVILVGHSMGSAIAMTAALDYPDRIAGLILLGASARLGVHPDILNNVLTDKSKAASLVAQWYWGPAAVDQMQPVSYARLMAVDSTVLHGDYVACNAFDIRPRLAEIRQPALIIGGTDDRLTPFKYSQSLREGLPDAELVRIDGGGHMMMLEQPAAVASAIQRWLTGRVW